jgi:hypothetical protein
VVKLDAQGNVLWSSSFDPLDAPDPMDVAVDSHDNVLVAVDGYGNPTLYGQALDNEGIVLVKLSSEGEVLFVDRYGESQLSGASGVAVAPDDGILLTGNLHGGVDFGGGRLESLPGDWSDSDIFIAGFDPQGMHRFSLRAGSTGLDSGTRIAALADGTVVATGWFSDEVDFGSGPLPDRGGSYVVWLQP